MSDSKNKLDLPESFIMTGYYLFKSAKEVTKYLHQALECLDQAVDDNNGNEETDHVYQHDVARARRQIYEALAGAQKAEQAHHLLDELSNRLGYRQITAEDFIKLGAGGR